MKKPSNTVQAQLDLLDEIYVDNFAGGGGASVGIELATGCPITYAINHDPDAIAMHEANHPYTKHLCESVWAIDPRKLCAAQKVALAWFSPDCKHFSKAKGVGYVRQIQNREAANEIAEALCQTVYDLRTKYSAQANREDGNKETEVYNGMD